MEGLLCPRQDRLLVRLDKDPRTFAGGRLIIAHVPDLDRNRRYRTFPQRGWVLAVGPKVEDVEVGDYIMMTTYNGVEPPRGFGKDLLLIREEFVLFKMDGKPTDINFGRYLEEWPGDRSQFTYMEGIEGLMEPIDD